MTVEELDRRIKTLETDTKVLKRLYFIKHRYNGKSVEKACDLVGVKNQWDIFGKTGGMKKDIMA